MSDAPTSSLVRRGFFSLPANFLQSRVRPLLRVASRSPGPDHKPRRSGRAVLRSAARNAIKVASIDVDRDPWWELLRRRRR